MSSLLALSVHNARAHPVIVHVQMTSNAVSYAQLYSQGYTNFIEGVKQ